jgi:hypothetical protein
MGCKYVVHVHAKLLDGWGSLKGKASLKTRSWCDLWRQMLRKLVRFHTLMCSHLPLKGMMVTICGKCEVDNILVLLTRFMPPSLSTQVALVNGHWEVIFVNIILLFYSLVLALHQIISLNIATPILGLMWWLKSMFIDLTYLQLDDGAFNDEDCNEDWVDEVNVVNIEGFATMDEDCC